MLAEIPVEQFGATVEQVAADVLDEADCRCPPVDALRLAKQLRLCVARDSKMNQRARFVRLQSSAWSASRGGRQVASGQDRVGRGTILLADEPRAERRQWAIAHEIGESVAHRVFAALEVPLVDIPPAGRERVANQLASCLLLPRDWFAADGSVAGWDLFELKRVYRTASHELIARRMLEMNPAVIITLVDQGAVQWRRSNSLPRPLPLTPTENRVWRTVFESGRPAECEGYALPEGSRGIQCWPVHEPGWRREIIRTELEVW